MRKGALLFIGHVDLREYENAARLEQFAKLRRAASVEQDGLVGFHAGTDKRRQVGCLKSHLGFLPMNVKGPLRPGGEKR